MKKLTYFLFAILSMPAVALAVDIPTADQVLNTNQQSWDIQSLIMMIGLTVVGVVIGVLAINALYVIVSGGLAKLEDVKFGKATIGDVAVYVLAGLGLLIMLLIIGYWIYDMWGG